MQIKMFRNLFTAVLLNTLAIGSVSADGDWQPQPNFSIEGSNYIETLTFISGIAYALEYSNKELLSKRKANFFCVQENQMIGSRLLIELLNEKLEGDYTSEHVVETLVSQLRDTYPC